MNNVLTILLFLSFLMTASRDAFALPSLCRPTEDILLSCETQKSHRFLSLCGKKPSPNNSGYIVYRFGRPQKIELEYPYDKHDAFKKFTYATYSRGGGKQNAGLNLFSVQFNNQGVDYDVFSDWSAEDSHWYRGVTVYANSDQEVTIECRDSVIDNIKGGTNILNWFFLQIEDLIIPNGR